MKEKIFTIDILKAFAICGVVLIHYNNYFPAPHDFIFKLTTTIGPACPQLFFLLSSFLLFASLVRRPLHTKGDVFQFLVSKLKRILPVYYIALVVFYFYGNSDVFSLLSHFFLVNGLFPHAINDIITVEWYLADLFILYFISPLLLYMASSLKRATLALFCSLFLSLVFRFVYSKVWHYFPTDYSISVYFSTFCFLIQLPGLLLGIIIYHLRNNSLFFNLKKAFFCLALVMMLLWLASVSDFLLKMVSHIFVRYMWWGCLLFSCLLIEKRLQLPPPYTFA